MSERDVPPAHAFHRRIVVTEADIDSLGHANNVVYVRWVQDAAVAHSHAVGLDMAAYRELGAVFVVRRHEIDYLLSARAGDAIEIATWVDASRGVTSLRKTVLTRAEDGKRVARAETTWVLLDVASGRPRRFPPGLMERFG